MSSLAETFVTKSYDKKGKPVKKMVKKAAAKKAVAKKMVAKKVAAKKASKKMPPEMIARFKKMGK